MRQKSATPARAIARSIEPLLYAASASSQLPLYFLPRVFIKRAEARVACSKLFRSSIQAVWRRPNALPVLGINCHRPEAVADEKALGLQLLSIWPNQAKSSGTPSWRNASRAIFI